MEYLVEEINDFVYVVMALKELCAHLFYDDVLNKCHLTNLQFKDLFRKLTWVVWVTFMY